MEEPDIEHATELDLAMAKSELPTKVAPIIDEGYDSLPKIASVTSEQSYLNEQVPTTHIKLESNNVRKPYLGTEISTDEWKPANIDTASDNSIHERSESTTSSESSAASDYIPTGVLRKWEPVNLATGKKVVVIAKPHHQVIERKAEILILNTAQSLEDEVIPILPDQGIATAPAADSSTSGGKPPKIKNQAKSWIVKSLRKLKIKPSTPKKPSRIVNMIQYALSIHKENGKSKELEENDALLIQISSGRSEEGRKFDSLYQVLHQIGAGGHSILRLAIQKQSGKRVVCKYVTRENIWHWHGSMPLEIHLMKRFGTKENAAFITFIDSVQIGDTFIIVMEYLENEWIDLYDYIEEFGPLNEAETRYIYKQVVDAVKWMHKQGFTHNDIKDENIMINRTTRQIKLIDFGSATRYQDNEVTTFYGTQKFACPESIQNKAYNLESQEVWALGTLLYVMLFKMDPFTSDYEILEMDLGKRISRLRRGLDTNAIVISDQVTELLVALTQKSSKNRPSLFNICNFAWLALE